jgi:putative ABC transport system permease protein
MVLVGGSTALFLVLVVLLSLRLRRREMEVLYMLGCSRGLMVRLQAVEIGVIVALSALLALGLAELLARQIPRYLGWG